MSVLCMKESGGIDRLGRKRSWVTMPQGRAGSVPGNKGYRRHPEPLSRDEVIRLVRATSRRGIGGVRDRALIVFLWRCGPRIAEALDLRGRDLDLDHACARIQHGKGDKFRMIAIDLTALKPLREWMSVRASLAIGDQAPVFCTISRPAPGGRMGAPAFRAKLKKIQQRAGVTRDVYPHVFRHTCARDMSEEGLSVLAIQQQLGHAHVMTTEHYIGRLMPTDRLKRIQQREEVQL